VAKKPKISKHIRENGNDLRDLMQEHLSNIAQNMIGQVSAAMKSLTPSNRLDAIHNITPDGINAYKADLLDALSMIASDAIEQARKEVPKAKKVKLVETNFDKLPPKLRDKIQTRNQLLIGKQVSDLQKTVEFAYAQNEDTTDSDDQVVQDMQDSAIGFIDGTAVEAGAQLTSAVVINEAREAFFFDDKVLEELDAFEFVNGDPVTPICQDLAGTIFAKDDPNMFRYTPPLHWNCKSYIVPVLAGDLGDRETSPLRPSKDSLNDYVQFHERIDFERSLDIIHGTPGIDAREDSHDHEERHVLRNQA